MSVAWAQKDGRRPGHPALVASGQLESWTGRIVTANDTGKTNGFASYCEGSSGWEWYVWEIPYDPYDVWNQYYVEHPDYLILENYRLGNAKSQEIDAIKALGIAELYAAKHMKRDVIYQETGIKSAMTDKLLKRNGLWAPGLPHANDASRHLLNWLIHVANQKFWLDVLRPVK